MRYVNPTKDDVKRNAGLLDSYLRYNKSQNNRANNRYRAAYDQAATANRKKNNQGRAKLAGNTPGKVARKKIVGAVYGGAQRTQATRALNESLGRKPGTPLKRKKKTLGSSVASNIVNGTNRVFANDGRTTAKKSAARGKSEFAKVAKRKQVRAGKARRK